MIKSFQEAAVAALLVSQIGCSQDATHASTIAPMKVMSPARRAQVDIPSRAGHGSLRPVPRNVIGLASPLPDTSNVSTDAELVFLVEVRPDVLKSDVESSITVRRVTDMNSVSGSFKWSILHSDLFVEVDRLVFSPSGELSPGDYVVTVSQHGTFIPTQGLSPDRPSLESPDGSFGVRFTVGSHLRVRFIRLVGKGDVLGYALIGFSEEVDLSSLKANLAIIAPDQQIIDFAGFEKTSAFDVRADPTTEVALQGPLVIQISSGVAGITGSTLDPDIGNGATLDVNFSLDEGSRCSTEESCWQWSAPVSLQ